MSDKFGARAGRLRRSGPLIVRYVLSSGSLASAALSQLVTFAILARSLGAAEFGLFVQISAVTAVAVQLCGLGASDCLLRRVSREPGSYPALLGHNLLLIAVTGAVLVVGGTAAMSAWIRLSAGPQVEATTLALLFCGNVVLVRIVLLVETAFLALQRLPAANRTVVGFAAMRMVVAALACLVFGVSSLADWALWQSGGCLFSALVAWASLRRLGRPRFAVLRDELRAGVLFSSQFVVRALRMNVDLLAIGLFASLETVGAYGVARRIADSSYLAIDALNRLVYPRLARESRGGLHLALPTARRTLLAALALGLASCVALVLLAPALPLLFGRDYRDLPFFVRCLSGTVVLVGAWAAAVDLLGASGRQGARAWILNGTNLTGSALVLVATWLAPPLGTIAALYAIDAAITAAAWIVVLRIARRDLANGGAGGATARAPS